MCVWVGTVLYCMPSSTPAPIPPPHQTQFAIYKHTQRGPVLSVGSKCVLHGHREYLIIRLKEKVHSLTKHTQKRPHKHLFILSWADVYIHSSSPSQSMNHSVLPCIQSSIFTHPLRILLGCVLTSLNHPPKNADGKHNSPFYENHL